MSSTWNENQLREFSQSISQRLANLAQQPSDVRLQLQQSLHDFVSIAYISGPPGSYGSASLNAICALIEAGSKGESSTGATSFLFLPGTWNQLCKLLLQTSRSHKVKPQRRFLLSLVTLLKRQPDPLVKQSLIDSAMIVCLDALVRSQGNMHVKPALQLLEQLLLQDLVTVQVVLNEYLKTDRILPEKVTISAENSAMLSTQRAERFVTACFAWIRYPDCAAVVGHFIALFCRAHQVWASSVETGRSTGRSANEVRAIWMSPVQEELRLRPESLETIETYILPPLLSLSKEIDANFIQGLPFGEIMEGRSGMHQEPTIHLCLVVSRVQSGLSSKFSSVNGSIDHLRLATSLLEHNSARIRTAALTLYVSHTLASRHLTSSSFLTLKDAIVSFHQEPNARSRNDFIASVSKLCAGFLRWKPNHLESLTREPDTTRDYSRFFLQWYLSYLISDLGPTKTFQNHITALKVFNNLLKSGTDAIALDPGSLWLRNVQFPNTLLESQLVRSLLDLLFDPFDEVRSEVGSILQKFTAPLVSKNIRTFVTMNTLKRHVDSMIKRAEHLSRVTTRADHADGNARLLQIAMSLGYTSFPEDGKFGAYQVAFARFELDISVAEEDLDKAIKYNPVHGNIAAIRYIVESSNSFAKFYPSVDLVGQIMSLGVRLWEIVTPILCFDTLEVNQVDMESTDMVSAGHNDILSYSWRAIKEFSFLMNSMIAPITHDADFIFDEEQKAAFLSIGELCFMQLAELRHRGAFSSVAQTFTNWCLSCSRLKDPGFQRYIDIFYSQTLACMISKASTLTRRSAGLPSMIIGLLSACPVGPFFDGVMDDLRRLAEEGVPVEDELNTEILPQVHALNCLKDILTESRFAAKADKYVSTLFDLAATCLESPTWAIRNSSLMLLKALLRRANCGTDISSSSVTSVNRQGSSMAYDRYTNLPDLVLKLLLPLADKPQNSLIDSSHHAQRYYPALEIIEQFGIPVQYYETITKEVERHRSGSIWSLRDKAAQALSSTTPRSDIIIDLGSLIRGPCTSHNSYHGRLLQVRWLLRRWRNEFFLENQGLGHEVVELLTRSCGDFGRPQTCSFIAATFWDIIAEIFEFCQKSKVNSFATTENCSRLRDVLKDISTDTKIVSPLLSQAVTRLQHQLDLHCSPVKSLEGRTGNIVAIRSQDPAGAALILSQTGLSLSKSFNVALDFGRDQFAAWCCSLHLALQVSHVLDQRLAAASAITDFLAELRKKEELARSVKEIRMIPCFMALYDALNDDDEEVRARASQGASLVISAWDDSMNLTNQVKHIHAYSAPAARVKLLDLLSQMHRDCVEFQLEAILRLMEPNERFKADHWFGQGSSHNKFATLRAHNGAQLALPNATMGSGAKDSAESIAKLAGEVLAPQNFINKLQELLHKNKILFEEESQNLYFDVTRDSEVWVQILLHAQQTDGVPATQSGTQIEHSFKDTSMDDLIQVLSDRDRGPLGICHDSACFSLLYRCIICLPLAYRSVVGTAEQLSDATKRLCALTKSEWSVLSVSPSLSQMILKSAELMSRAS